MDIELSKDDLAFREEVRAWIQQAMPAHINSFIIRAQKSPGDNPATAPRAIFFGSMPYCSTRSSARLRPRCSASSA